MSDRERGMKTKASCKLSPRQAECLEYIIDYIARYSYPPNIREISELMDIESRLGSTCHLTALHHKGAIDWRDGFNAIKILVQDKRLDKLRAAKWIGENMEKRSLREIMA